MDEFDSGAYIGEAKAMYENAVHTTSVRATRKSIIFKIFKNELLTFLSKNPGLYIFFNDYKFID
jgi:CRP-like cAMP-binding protein